MVTKKSHEDFLTNPDVQITSRALVLVHGNVGHILYSLRLPEVA